MEGLSIEPSIYNISQIDFLPITAAKVKNATSTDPILSKVLSFILNGLWTEIVTEEMKPFQQRSRELTSENGTILWGIRVVIPERLQGTILHELHSNHPGISRMKSIARSYIWWPKIDKHIEELVKNCVDCQSNRDKPAVAPLHPWVWPSKPWQRVHIDFAGSISWKELLIISGCSL